MSNITSIALKQKLRRELYKPATKDVDPIRFHSEENRWGLILNGQTLGQGYDENILGVDGKMKLISDLLDTIESHVLSEDIRLENKINLDVHNLKNELLGGASLEYSTLKKLENFIKSNKSEIDNLESKKIDKTSISNSTTSIAQNTVGSSLAVKNTMDRANQAHALAETKVSKAGDTYTGTHNLTSATLQWSLDTDIAKIYMKNNGGNLKHLTIAYGDDIGSDSLNFEWLNTNERLAEFHQNKFLFFKDIYEKGTKLETKYALANGTTTRDFNVSDLYVHGGDIYFKSGSTTTGSVSFQSTLMNYNVPNSSHSHSVRVSNVEKINVNNTTTTINTNTNINGNTNIVGNLDVRSTSGAQIDFSNNTSSDYNVRLKLVTPTTFDVQGVDRDGFMVRGYRVLTTERQGHGSDIDADKVDGIQGSQIVRNDINNTITGNINLAGKITIKDGIELKSADDSNVTQFGSLKYHHADVAKDGVSFTGEIRARQLDGATLSDNLLFSAKGFSADNFIEGSVRLVNKYLGIRATAVNSDKLGNRTSSQYEQIDVISTTITGVTGWYTVAKGVNRCSAKFKISDATNGRHGHATFYADVSYGNNANITILSKGFYSGNNGGFDKIRIVRIDGDSTYGNYELQVYIENGSAIRAYIMEDLASHQGWMLANFEAGSTSLEEKCIIDLSGKNSIITTGTIYSNSDKRVYDTGTPPTKAEVGLSNVPNYSATSSLTDGSASKFATATATKSLEDKKIDKTSIFNDTNYANGMTSTQVVGGLVGQNFLNRINKNESDIVDIFTLLNDVSNNGTFDSLKELIDYMNANSAGIELVNTKVNATITNIKNSKGQYYVTNLGGYEPNQWLRSDVDDVFEANYTLANTKKLNIGDAGNYITRGNDAKMTIFSDDELIINGGNGTTIAIGADKAVFNKDIYVGSYKVFRQGNITKSDVGLSVIPNAKSDSISLDDTNTLATSKAVKTLNNEVIRNEGRLTTNENKVTKINTDMGIGTYTHSSFVKKAEDNVITAETKHTGRLLSNKMYNETKNNIFIPNPIGGYIYSNVTTTGVIKIKLPVLWSNDYVNFKVNITTDDQNRDLTLLVSGKLNTGWSQPTVKILSNSKDRDFKVVFGNNSNNAYLVIGETTNTYNKLSVFISDVSVNSVDNSVITETYDKNWSIVVENSISDILVNHTINDSLVSTEWDKIKNRPSYLISSGTSDRVNNSDKLNGLTSDKFVRTDIDTTINGHLTMTKAGSVIKYKDSLGTFNVLALETGDANGMAVTISGGGRTILSSGEAANFKDNLCSKANETVGVMSDQDIRLITNLQTNWESRKEVSIGVNGDITTQGQIFVQDKTKKVFHQGFMGAGSGLDADTVDGKQLSQLIQTDVSSQTINGGTNTTINIVSADNGVSEIKLMGSNEGTGRVYVGQSDTLGGGIEYNGDNTPTSTGAGADYIAMYRKNGSSSTWTARNSTSNNDWEFRGNVKAETMTISGWTMSVVEI